MTAIMANFKFASNLQASCSRNRKLADKFKAEISAQAKKIHQWADLVKKSSQSINSKDSISLVH